jgi:dTDP-4-amino-4,6-dideoxygalactose transaminase
MKVSRYNYGAQFGRVIKRTLDEMQSVLTDGDYILGVQVSRFENAFASFVGARYCVGVNSGTDALILGLIASGVKSGSRVAVQANTFHATVLAIVRIGAVPVLIDADPKNFLMDLDALERRRDLDAILPVHLFGLATDVSRVRLHAERIGAVVIEDCAQSHGAVHDGRVTGSQCSVGCFSFHPSKNLAAAGDAGACVTNDPKLAERLRELRHLGQREQNEHVGIGFNSRLDSIQAVILNAKLPMLAAWNDARIAVAERYRAELSNLPVTFQAAGGPREHVYHLFQLRTGARDGLLSHLKAAGVDATIRYPVSIQHQPAFQNAGWTRGAYPVADALASELLCLPIRPDMSEQEVDHVVSAVRGFFR